LVVGRLCFCGDVRLVLVVVLRERRAVVRETTPQPPPKERVTFEVRRATER
jgi:hypothetical protein